jgi:hypothetical protein
VTIATITIAEKRCCTSGDYNNHGIVNVADYIVWRNHAGTDFALVNRDPNTSGDTYSPAILAGETSEFHEPKRRPG